MTASRLARFWVIVAVLLVVASLVLGRALTTSRMSADIWPNPLGPEVSASDPSTLDPATPDMPIS